VAAAMKRRVNRNIGSWVVFNEDEKYVSSRDSGQLQWEKCWTGLVSVSKEAFLPRSIGKTSKIFVKIYHNFCHSSVNHESVIARAGPPAGRGSRSLARYLATARKKDA
jgi:hypothetical protein